MTEVIDHKGKLTGFDPNAVLMAARLIHDEDRRIVDHGGPTDKPRPRPDAPFCAAYEWVFVRLQSRINAPYRKDGMRQLSVRLEPNPEEVRQVALACYWHRRGEVKLV